MSPHEFLLVTKEAEFMLKKEAIQKTSLKKDQFFSNLFLVGKNNRGDRPVINLQNLNAIILYLHFKKKRLNLLNRPEGCLLLCSTASKTSEVHPVLLGRSFIRIPLSMF